MSSLLRDGNETTESANDKMKNAIEHSDDG